MNSTAKLITEFIGTFFLCLVVALCVGNADLPTGAKLLSIGSVLMVMIYAGGHISGGHYNPAVTMAVLVRGRIKMSEAVMYWVAQILAGVVAALLATAVFGASGDGGAGTIADDGLTAALIGELLGTFALAYVVLNTATAKETAGNSNYGLAIGFTVVACGIALGGFSGGAFNPSVAVSQSIASFFSWGDIWVYLVACLAGGALAGLVFNMNNPDDK